MPRLGVFLIPPPEHPFYRIATAILGYDVWQQRHQTSSLSGHLDSATLTHWLGRAPTWGLHCTITGGDIVYDDADVPEIKERLAWIAGRTAPFTLTNGRFFHDFHANPQALVTRFDSPDGAVDRLHRQAATLISPLYTATHCGPPGPDDDDRARQLYLRTGETHALERFTPHWSLLTGLPDASAWMSARDLIAQHTGLFADDQTRTVQVTEVHLVEGSGDGFGSVISSYPLTGRP